MCSVVVQLIDSQLIITMNRDERRERAVESPPFTWPSGLEAPRDESALGTWIGCMPDGRWACLLNSYDTTVITSHSRSRGEIIPNILSAEDPGECLFKLASTYYKPFRLLLGKNIDSPMLFHWNGQVMHCESVSTLPYFISSSSWNSKIVISQRHRAFADWLASNEPHDDEGRPLISLWQEQENPEMGIFMSRHETRTTSMTQIKLREDSLPTIQYWAIDQLRPVRGFNNNVSATKHFIEC